MSPEEINAVAGLTPEKIGLDLYPVSEYGEYGELNGTELVLIAGPTSENEESDADADAEAAAAALSSERPGEATATLEELLADTVFSTASEMTSDGTVGTGSIKGAQGTTDSSTTLLIGV